MKINTTLPTHSLAHVSYPLSAGLIDRSSQRYWIAYLPRNRDELLDCTIIQQVFSPAGFYPPVEGAQV